MSFGPPGGGNPFEGFPLFGDLARMFASQGPVNWDVARQMAMWIATEGKPQGNVDPVERIRLEELARVADMHVGARTGLSTSVSGGVLSVLPVSRGDWALHSLESYRSLLEKLATALNRPDEGDAGGGAASDAGTQFLGDLGKLLGPVLLGLQSGVMLGHLARHSFGQYDLPLPRRAADQLLVIPANVDGFASEWSLEADDLRMFVCLHEITTHAVVGRPHVRRRLARLLEDYVSRFHVDPDAVEASFGEIDLNDPGALQRALGNPETLLGAVQTPEQQEVKARIDVLLTAVAGYVEHVVEGIAHPLVGSYDRIAETVRRRRAEATEGERFAGRLLGLELSRRHYERGAAFARGVVERAGDGGLARLWHSEREFPTAAEIDAPGLWLARIDLPD